MPCRLQQIQTLNSSTSSLAPLSSSAAASPIVANTPYTQGDVGGYTTTDQRRHDDDDSNDESDYTGSSVGGEQTEQHKLQNRNKAHPTATRPPFHTNTSSSISNKDPLLPRPLILPGAHGATSSANMARRAPTGMVSAPAASTRKPSIGLILSYVLDWLVITGFAAVAFVLGDIEPIKRPFDLENQTITFPFTEEETFPVTYLYVTNAALPSFFILVIALIFVPGPTVPRGTPKSMIWRRKLWELHTGWLGLAFTMCVAIFITNGLKNMYGKPRPDMLSRCLPDLENKEDYYIGAGRLVTAAICTQTDVHKLDDGFRSFPSGHSSSAAAGLIYLSLFIASKFTITMPFIAPSTYPNDASFAAFPSRLGSPTASHYGAHDDDEPQPPREQAENRISSHSRNVLAARLQAAAPPLYLFGIAVLPFFGAVFIASSRWFDYRHHALDIFSGFLIGTLSAFFGFRWYHMPINQGAGWAWGPRSKDKAFWAGLGSYSFATDRKKYYIRNGDEEECIEGAGIMMNSGVGGSFASQKSRSTGLDESLGVSGPGGR